MWKRLNIYEGIITIKFICILVFYILNQDFFNYIISKDIAGYLFWLSLGLCLGFWLCKYEMKRMWKKSWEENQEKEKERNIPISPN